MQVLNDTAFTLFWIYEHLRKKAQHGDYTLKNHQRVLEHFNQEVGRPLILQEYRSIPSRNTFLNHLKNKEPVVLRQAAKNWPALNKWDFHFLKENYGDVSVPSLEPIRYNDSEFLEEPLGKFLERIESGEKRYCKFSDFLYRAPELFKDLNYHELEGLKPKLSLKGTLQFFIGPGEINTRLHNAIGHNFFTQITGRKIWKIYPHKYTSLFLPKITDTPHHIADDRYSYPHLVEELQGKLDYWEIELHPGDILFNPSFLWHTVESPTSSIAIKSSWISTQSITSDFACSTISLLSLLSNFIANKRKIKSGAVFPHKDWI